MTAIVCITGWTLIAVFLLRANHRAHREPTPEPRPWYVTDGVWDYPPPVAEPDTHFIRVLPPVPATRSELAWVRDQPVTVLRGTDLRMRFDDVIDSTRRAEQVQR